MTNYMHFMFGGEVYNAKEQKRVSTNDLVIIEQEVHIEKQFVQVAGNSDDPNVPRVGQRQNKSYAEMQVCIQRVKSVRKVVPVNGK